MGPHVDRIVLAVILALFSFSVRAEQRVSDQQITRSLQETLQRDSRLKNADIQVSSVSGLVTLRGSVSSLREKHQAEQLTKRTTGVRSVSNMIQVKLAARRDDDLVADVQRRLRQSTFISPRDLRVNASGGVVTLAGEVDSWTQSRQAERLAREVRGVKLVHNELAVAGTSGSGLSRSDAQIKADVEAAFDRDAYLAGLPVQVTVESGPVER